MKIEKAKCGGYVATYRGHTHVYSDTMTGAIIEMLITLRRYV